MEYSNAIMETGVVRLIKDQIRENFVLIMMICIRVSPEMVGIRGGSQQVRPSKELCSADLL